LKNMVSTLLRVNDSEIEIKLFGNNLIITIDDVNIKNVNESKLYSLKNKIKYYYYNYY